MKIFRGALVVAVAMLAAANAQSAPITFRNEIYLVQETAGPNGTRAECFTPATEAGPGDVVEYRIFATNAGETTLPPGAAQINVPVPTGLQYVVNTATPTSDRVLTEFSVDGATFSAPPIFVGSGADRRSADPTEYKMVRWTLIVPFEPGAEEPFAFRARLPGRTFEGDTPQTCSGPGFRILSVTYRWEGDYLYVIGELQNVSGAPMGVELQAIARNASGRLVDTVNFWPASVSNIAAGAHYGFRHPVTQQRSAVTVEVQVVSTFAW